MQIKNIEAQTKRRLQKTADHGEHMEKKGTEEPHRKRIVGTEARACLYVSVLSSRCWAHSPPIRIGGRLIVPVRRELWNS